MHELGLAAMCCAALEEDAYLPPFEIEREYCWLLFGRYGLVDRYKGVHMMTQPVTARTRSRTPARFMLWRRPCSSQSPHVGTGERW